MLWFAGQRWYGEPGTDGEPYPSADRISTVRSWQALAARPWGERGPLPNGSFLHNSLQRQEIIEFFFKGDCQAIKYKYGVPNFVFYFVEFLVGEIPKTP